MTLSFFPSARLLKTFCVGPLFLCCSILIVATSDPTIGQVVDDPFGLGPHTAAHDDLDDQAVFDAEEKLFMHENFRKNEAKASTLPLTPMVEGNEVPQETVLHELTGAELFEKLWEPIEDQKTNDHGGPDGLGPMFNARACVTCHNLGAVGGAGGNDANVQILTVLPRQTSRGIFRLDDTTLKNMFENSSHVDSRFKNSNSIVLHRSSTLENKFQQWQVETLDFRSIRRAKAHNTAAILESTREQLREEDFLYRVHKGSGREQYTLQITHRNTPSLFGSGAIDQIPDERIVAQAKVQAKDDGPIKGVVARLDNGQVGKFGWRGQHRSVKDFTVEACAVELGLSNSFHSQNKTPFEVEEGYQSQTQFDMTDEQIERLNSFIITLSKPSRTIPQTRSGEKLIKRGEKLFTKFSCSKCHVQNMGEAKNVFSDFLLHNMGEELADAANSIYRRTEMRAGLEFSLGAKVLDDERWQTPPLWGVANSAPYLHDGRAPTLRDAILMHGGEAARSARNFANANIEKQDELLMFVDSIGGGDRINTFDRPPTSAKPVVSGGW